MKSFKPGFVGLRCVTCKTQCDSDKLYYLCPQCGNLLDPEYDYSIVKPKLSQIMDRKERNIWRWRELFPILTDRHVTSLGEGGTPLLKSARLAEYCGVKELWLKNDTVNPTGSLKDRSIPIAVAKALEFGFSTIACDSTGNKAASVAAYATRAGLKSVVFCNATTSKEKLAQAVFYGAKLVRVEGDYTEVNNLYKEMMKDPAHGWYDCGTSNPYRYEGKKTYAYEVAELLEWDVPDRMVHPANGGMSLSKTFKGFSELKTLGLVDFIPRMTVVQAKGYDSIAIAAGSMENEIRSTQGGKTLASALASRDPGDLGRLALAAIRNSGGTGISVDKEEIIDSVIQLAHEGVLVEPSGAVSIGGLRKLVQDGKVSPSERVVCVLTGSGFKDLQFIMQHVELADPVKADLQSLRIALKDF